MKNEYVISVFANFDYPRQLEKKSYYGMSRSLTPPDETQCLKITNFSLGLGQPIGKAQCNFHGGVFCAKPL